MTDTYHAYNTIGIKPGRGDFLDEWVKANAAVTPGMLVEKMSTGNWRKHATAGGNASPIFAFEDSLQGNDIDDDYSASNQMRIVQCLPGDLIYGFIADGENVTIGTYLESAGNGYLRAYRRIDLSSFNSHTTGLHFYYNSIVAIADEAKQTNTSTSEGLRCRIRIL